MTQADIKWFTPDSFDGERSLKQHGIKPRIQKEKWTRESYPGNLFLCGQGFVSDDGENGLDWQEIEAEPKRDNCCKKCDKIFNTLNA